MKIVVAHFSSSWVDTSGGVEKMICELSNAMVERGHEVTVLYVEHREGLPYFPLDRRVKTKNILYENGKQVVMEKLALPLRIYREILRAFSKKRAREINAKYKGKLYGQRIHKWLCENEADIVISVSAMSAKYLMIDGQCAIPMIEMIHEDPQIGFPALSAAEMNALKKASVIQVLLPEDLSAVHEYFPDVEAVVIGNTVGEPQKHAAPGAIKQKHKIINVGTVCSRKNQKLLVEAFENLAEKYPEWSVELWGWHGAYYGKALEEYIARKRLGQQVSLKGVTKEIAEVYAQGDIFAYPSKSEGFPLGLLEAMSVGLPVIGLKSCHGTNYLIQNGENGFLTDESVESFQDALEALMADAVLREKMGKAGKEKSKEYNAEVIWDEWESLLKRVVQGTN